MMMMQRNVHLTIDIYQSFSPASTIYAGSISFRLPGAAVRIAVPEFSPPRGFIQRIYSRRRRAHNQPSCSGMKSAADEALPRRFSICHACPRPATIQGRHAIIPWPTTGHGSGNPPRNLPFNLLVRVIPRPDQLQPQLTVQLAVEPECPAASGLRESVSPHQLCPLRLSGLSGFRIFQFIVCFRLQPLQLHREGFLLAFP